MDFEEYLKKANAGKTKTTPETTTGSDFNSYFKAAQPDKSFVAPVIAERKYETPVEEPKKKSRLNRAISSIKAFGGESSGITPSETFDTTGNLRGKTTGVGNTVLQSIGTGLTRDLPGVLGSGFNVLDKALWKGSLLDPGREVYERRDKFYKDYAQNTQKRLEAKIGAEAADSFVSQASRGIGQGIGQLGLAVVSAPVGLTALTGMSIGAGKSAYDDAYDTLISQGKAPEEARRIANINGIVTGAVNSLEALPVFRALGFGKDILNKTINKTVSATVSRILKDAGVESVTEGVQQFGQDITAKFTFDPNRPTVKNAIMATLVAIPTGLLFGGVGEINVRQRNNILQKAADDISVQLEEVGVKPEAAQESSKIIVSQYAITGDDTVFDIPKENVTDTDVADSIRSWINRPYIGDTRNLPPPNIISKLKEDRPGVNELEYSEDGTVTLYREGDIIPGEIQSYSIKQGEGQVPVQVNKKQIIANLASKDMKEIFARAYSDKKDIQDVANNEMLARWGNLESEVLVESALTPYQLRSKVKQLIPSLEAAVKDGDENVITGIQNMAQQSDDKELISEVKKALKNAEVEAKKSEENAKKMQEYIEKSQQPEDADLTNPVFEPYRPARAIPADRVYQNSPTSKFIVGEFEGTPYTSDAYILEFNSDVQPPKKIPEDMIARGDKAPSESALRQLLPADEDLQSAEITKAEQSEDGKTKIVTLESDDVKLSMQQKYFDYFTKKYPGAIFKVTSDKKPVVVYKGGERVGLIMPMIDVSKKGMVTTWEKPPTMQPRLADTEIEKPTPAQKKIKQLETKNKKLEEKASKRGLSSGELGSLASPHGNKTIRKIIERQKNQTVDDVQTVPSDFKISERAKSILESFSIPVGEKTLSSRLLGVFKPLTEKVRVQALYDVTTVTHEAVHAIDHQDNFSKNLIESTGRGATIRNRLTDIYEELYPKAKRTHKLDTRIKEGLAVLFENYFYDPASIQEKYPDLVDAFIKPEGEYYNPKFTQLLEAMNELVDDYAALSPEQRIGSRIRTGKEVVDKQTGFSKKQRLEYEIFNRFEPLKRYGQEAGVAATWDDPFVQAFNIMNKNTIITNWVKGNNTPILMRDGNFKIEKGSVQDYVKLIKGKENAFRSYLVARRVVADNNKLNDLKNEIREINEIDAEDGDVDILAMQNEISKLQKTIERDDFSLQDATAVVEKYASEFGAAEKIYDDINRRLLDFSVENDLIDAETANLYKNETGYASFRRYIEEELVSVGTIKTSAKSKVTSFKERTGSQLDIVDPIYSQIIAINEIIGKGMENRLWAKVSDIANKNPEISQRFEKVKSEPSIDGNGNVSFPQEKQPDIIRIFRKGKREFYRAGPEFIAVSKQLRGKEYDAFVQLLRIPSSLFTRLTTSANPPFAIGNMTVDQLSALAQTKTGFKPVADPAKSFVAYITSDKGMQAYIAMGGKRQTLASFYDLSPDQIVHQLTGGETKMEKVSSVIDSAVGILEIPSNVSEIMTRYSEFSRAKDMGKSDSEAMFMAAEVTTPFQLQGNFWGRFGQEFIKSIPYLNSIVQFLYKYGRSAKDNPVRIGTITAALFTTGLTAAIAVMKGSSDEQKRLLAEQPVRNLSRYLYFPSPNGKDLIKIRIPEQMGVFTGMAYLYVFEKYGGNEAVFNDYLDVVSSAIPEQVQFWNPSKAGQSWLPQVIKPAIQTIFNTKTFPEIAPIVPYYMQGRTPSEQYNNYTSRVAKAVGQWLNISPAKFEFFIRAQFGAVGGAVLGKLPGNPITIQEKEYVMTGRSYNRFYENRELIQQNYDEMLKDNPDKYTYEQKYEAKSDLKLYSNVSEILTEMGKINKKEPLPEEVKSLAYEVLLGLDGNTDVTPQVYKLKEELYKLK